MTDQPLPTKGQLSEMFADIRRPTQFLGAGRGRRYCDLEDDLDDLVERVRRAPSDLTQPDGYPAGGDGGRGGAAELTSVEAAANARMAAVPDEVEPLVRRAVEFIQQAAWSVKIADECVAKAKALAGRDEDEPQCVEPSCPDAAVPGGGGRCEACRGWHRDEAKRAVREGRDPRHFVPPDLIAERQTRRRRVAPGV